MTDVVATAAEAAALTRPPLLVLDPLLEFLDIHGIGSGTLDEVAPIGDGHSNVTYHVRRGDKRVILRRPPRPPYPASAHDVVREARLLSALYDAGARVPRVLALCENDGLLGAPFYIMEFVDGHVVSRSWPRSLEVPGAREAVGAELVAVLAELHALDVETGPLGTFGRPSGYLERQLRRFRSIWADRSTRNVPEVERVADWLAAHLPASAQTTVVHGDFRLGNVILATSPPVHAAAVLDWEMATIGDPLADLGYLVATWASPDDAEETPMHALSSVTREHGFATRGELRETYADRTGRDVSGIAWYEVLALWKSAVFLEASYARHCEGTTDDPYFGTLVDGVPALGRAALARIRQAS